MAREQCVMVGVMRTVTVMSSGGGGLGGGDEDVGQVDDGEGAEREGVFGVGDGGD